jgi:hypothetical protein
LWGEPVTGSPYAPAPSATVSRTAINKEEYSIGQNIVLPVIMSMDFFTRYHKQRLACRPAIDSFLNELTPTQVERALMLNAQLAIKYSESGHVVDILTRPDDYPILYIHFWLLDDWQIEPGPQRQLLEQHILPAAWFAVWAGYLRHCIRVPDNPFDQSFLELVEVLQQESWHHLHAFFPLETPFWQKYPPFTDDPAWNSSSDLMVGPVFRVVAAITATTSGHNKDLPVLHTLLEELTLVIQSYRQLLSVRRDIHEGHMTPVVRQAIAQTGASSGQDVDPQQILGAFVLYRIGTNHCRQVREHLLKAQQMANQLSLPTFQSYLDHWGTLLDNLEAFFSGEITRPPSGFLPVTHTLKESVAAAADYLLADQTFQAAWDIQRGLVPSETLLARAFPAGLVVENLHRAGHSLPEAIDNIFFWLQTSNFRYYEEYTALPPDADDLGLLLRLHRFGPDERQKAYRRLLALPLKWMTHSIRASGEIPVWFEMAQNQDPSSEIKVWGHRCAATEINLLLGLLDFDSRRYHTICQSSVANVMTRFKQSGMGASYYYGLAYTMWVVLQLFNRLESLKLQHPDILSWALEQFDRLAEAPSTSQTAAFLLLAQHTHDLPGYNKTDWIRQLIKRQRHDGSWNAEPLFLVPHRLGATWYASRPVTSSYCYLAFKQLAGID